MMVLLSSCTGQSSSNGLTDDQIANRTYMTQVSQTMDTLKSDLAAFSQAVADDDIVSMNAQADNANRTIANLAALTPPDALKDVHSEYVSGCEELRNALSAYLDLYNAINAATDEEPFDYSTYEKRLSDIEDLYNSGISHLEKADQEAKDME